MSKGFSNEKPRRYLEWLRRRYVSRTTTLPWRIYREIWVCTRPQPHDGPCNGWPCDYVQRKVFHKRGRFLMSVRAKFRVRSITRQQGYGRLPDGTNGPVEVRTVHLDPVSAGNDPNHENAKFWAASPSGSIDLGCANLQAAEVFELGQEFYVDFTRAE